MNNTAGMDFPVNRSFKHVVTLVGIFVFSLMPVAYADSIGSPVDLLKDASDRVIAELKKNNAELKQNPRQLKKLINELILPHIDSVTMAKLALGKNWRKASRDQKKKFVIEFRSLLLRTYSKSLTEYSDQKFRFFPVRLAPGDTKTIVKSEVIQDTGPSIPISYRMRIKNGKWKIYDVNIDGVSLVTSYRGTFNKEIRQNGIDGMLDILAKKNNKVRS